MSQKGELTHLDPEGRPRMVDVERQVGHRAHLGGGGAHPDVA